MSLAHDNDLTAPAARLALAAPSEWAQFMAALRMYAATRADQLVQADLDGLQRSQGRAQQCKQFVALLDDAIQSANRVKTPAGKPKP